MTQTPASLRIGTAGWSIPRELEDGEGSGLERYASRLGAVEINTTFYRPHQASTYERWRSSTPDGFKFSVKAPKQITHAKRLVGANADLAAFIDQIQALGEKLGPVLFQLPPSLAFDFQTAADFLESLRSRFAAAVALEPRHTSWFSSGADQLLADHDIARVAADPLRAPDADRPGGTKNLAYFRLHGSPRMYYSEYGAARLATLHQATTASGAPEVWCIFDNTTSGAALTDALALQRLAVAPQK